jgi:ubiquitin-like 1-activating enzyme E1 A
MSASATTLSDKEAQIYDRQIRLWGVDAQQRIQKTRILVYGITGLAAEICKNIVLAGVGTVHIMDNQSVDYALLGTNFFVNESHVGKNRATSSLQNLQELNPLVKVSAEEASISSKNATDDAFWSRFDMVFLTNCNLSEQIRVNDICRSRGILFFAADTCGLLAILFQDLLKFDYSVYV